MRFLPILLAVPIFAGSHLLAEVWPETAETFFAAHCYECHDEDVQKGGLDLTALANHIEDGEQVARWTRIHDRVRDGEMPPAKKPRPPADEKNSFLTALNSPLTTADRALREVAMRRLNRTEYEHSMHDLLGVDTLLAKLLPEDAVAGGFDNNGAALQVSAEQIGRYIEASRAALDDTITLEAKPVPETRMADSLEEIRPYLGKQFGHHNGRSVIYNSNSDRYSKLSSRKARAPQEGRYRLRFTAAAHNTDKPITFSVTGPNWKPIRHLGYYEAPPGGKMFTLEVDLEYHTYVQFFAQGLPPWVNDADTAGVPGLGIGPVEVTGPLPPDSWPPEPHRRLLGNANHENGTPEEAARILRNLADRAFRRPATDDEVARYLALFTAAQETHRPFLESLRIGMEGILCSTNFLYLKEDSDKLNDHQFAARLALFLWSSLPDDQLRELAQKGTLREPATLRGQVARMLKDPRADRLVKHFCGQWLLLREINATTPDAKLHKDFDEVLQASMIWEAEGFFRHLITEDLPIDNFLDSDFAMLNARLAEHYGIEGVTGLEVKPVKLPPDSPRGGVLTQAAVLKVTANGTNTSPVIRGAWVLENILGKQIPPPPPGIGGIEPDIRDATTIREQLDLHRESESCNTCHQYIDPPGFALEVFDPTGAFRSNYPLYKENKDHPGKGWGHVEQGKPVDASGQLSTGEPFADFREFKALLVEQSDRFAHTLTERLLTYALGRELGFSDRTAIAKIAKRTKADGNGMHTLIENLVLSDTFQSP